MSDFEFTPNANDGSNPFANDDVFGGDGFVGQARTLIPGGTIAHVAITKSEIATTKNGKKNLSLTYKVQDGDFKGKVFFESLFMWKPVSDAGIEMAKSKLAAIRIACGLDSLKGPSDLLGKAMKVSIGLEENSEYGDKNVAKKYMPADPEFLSKFNSGGNSNDIPF